MHICQSELKLQDRFAIRNNGMMQVIFFGGIHYIEAKRNYSQIVTEKGKNFLIHVSIKTLEKKLPASLFLRIHKSFIVYLPSITGFDHQHIYIGDRNLPLAATIYRLLCERFIIAEEDHNQQIDEKIRDISLQQYLPEEKLLGNNS